MALRPPLIIRSLAQRIGPETGCWKAPTPGKGPVRLKHFGQSMASDWLSLRGSSDVGGSPFNALQSEWPGLARASSRKACLRAKSWGFSGWQILKKSPLFWSLIFRGASSWAATRGPMNPLSNPCLNARFVR